MRATVPLRQRPVDLASLVFYAFNLLFISYFFDLEQVLIANTSNFSYPAWPPKFLVDLSHWWGRNYDPLLLARPVFWRATVWIDVLLFGPFYAVAIYAYVRGKEWIRIPAIIYSSVMLTTVTIILSEEIWGTHATASLGAVLAANALWIVFPVLILARMCPNEHPFSVSSRPKMHIRRMRLGAPRFLHEN